MLYELVLGTGLRDHEIAALDVGDVLDAVCGHLTGRTMPGVSDRTVSAAHLNGHECTTPCRRLTSPPCKFSSAAGPKGGTVWLGPRPRFQVPELMQSPEEKYRRGASAWREAVTPHPVAKILGKLSPIGDIETLSDPNASPLDKLLAAASVVLPGAGKISGKGGKRCSRNRERRR